LAVGAGGDDHALAGLENLGGLVDSAKGPRVGAGSVVVGFGGVVVYEISLREFQRLFPGDKLRAVGQARVHRRSLLIGSGRTGGGIVLRLAEDTSAESNHGAHAGRILEKAPAIDGWAGKVVL